MPSQAPENPPGLIESAWSEEALNVAGHRLLPLWEPLVKGLSRLGSVCVISRNHHVVMGGVCHYPVETGLAHGSETPEFHADFTAWNQGWFYNEMVNGDMLSCIEFRDRGGLGFHKIILREESELDAARTLIKAFEQEPLTEQEVAGAFKTNHLDGACCPQCQEQQTQETRECAVVLRQFIQSAIAGEKPMRVALVHEGLVTVRRFVPRHCNPNGPWQVFSGDDHCLYVRSFGLGSVDFFETELADEGLCRLAILRNRRGELIASFMVEDEA